MTTERALRITDAPAITGILAAIEQADPVDEAFSVQDIVEELGAPGIDLERGSIGVFDRDQLVGFGWLQIGAPAELWKATTWGGVHPTQMGRGIGRRILSELAADATRIRDADARGRPGRFQVWVEGNRPRTAALVAAAGLPTLRYYLRMQRDLRDPVPPPTAPPGVRIRQYRASDEEAVRSVSNAAFADHWGSTPVDLDRWRAEYTDASWFRPNLSHVALIDDQLVSFVLVAEYDAETAMRGYPTGYLARVGTLRSARGRFIASSLVGATLHGLAAAGYRCADLGVDAESLTGAGRIYERVGFVTTARDRLVGRDF